MYLGFSAVGLVFLSLTLPETKGKSLEEIEGIFAVPWFGEHGTLQPYTKKVSQFNYVHMDESAEPKPARQTEEEEKINTRICTNRQLSTDDSISISTRHDSDSDDGQIPTRGRVGR